MSDDCDGCKDLQEELEDAVAEAKRWKTQLRDFQPLEQEERERFQDRISELETKLKDSNAKYNIKDFYETSQLNNEKEREKEKEYDYGALARRVKAVEGENTMLLEQLKDSSDEISSLKKDLDDAGTLADDRLFHVGERDGTNLRALKTENAKLSEQLEQMKRKLEVAERKVAVYRERQGEPRSLDSAYEQPSGPSPIGGQTSSSSTPVGEQPSSSARQEPASSTTQQHSLPILPASLAVRPHSGNVLQAREEGFNSARRAPPVASPTTMRRLPSRIRNMTSPPPAPTQSITTANSSSAAVPRIALGSNNPFKRPSNTDLKGQSPRKSVRFELDSTAAAAEAAEDDVVGQDVDMDVVEGESGEGQEPGSVGGQLRLKFPQSVDSIPIDGGQIPAAVHARVAAAMLLMNTHDRNRKGQRLISNILTVATTCLYVRQANGSCMWHPTDLFSAACRDCTLAKRICIRREYQKGPYIVLPVNSGDRQGKSQSDEEFWVGGGSSKLDKKADWTPSTAAKLATAAPGSSEGRSTRAKDKAASSGSP